MPEENLSRHTLRGVHKALQHHEVRLERKERQRARAAERAELHKEGTRRKDWLEEDQPTLEPVRRRSPSTPQITMESASPALALVRGGGDASRRNGGRDQVIAANVSLAVLVCTPSSPPFRPSLIDRFLVATARDGLTAILCLNKIDLGVTPEVEALLDGFARLGIAVVRTSATTGLGLEELKARISGKTAVFTGHSGVGKSSLLNALAPGLQLLVGEVSPRTAGQGKGRHTTTAARLIPLDSETSVVDSPGIRMFGIRGVDPDELEAFFPDLQARGADCAFRDCSHHGEAGCAVETAATMDAFLRRRLDSYRRIRSELR